MEVVILKEASGACLLAARVVRRQVEEKPGSVLGLATGNTMVEVYAELERLHREEALDFGAVTTFNLDEYVGLDPSHPCSYHRFMREHLFDRVNLDRGRSHLPDGLAADIPASCRDYEIRIQGSGGIDLQLLGLGEDGHVGFNEPGSSLASRTRIKTLTPLTRAANRACFSPGEVPSHVLTMGVGTIMDARHCLLLAFGAKKAAAVAGLVEGPVTARLPASALQLHPRVTVLLDEAAASQLELAEYYRAAYEGKPSWQRL